MTIPVTFHGPQRSQYYVEAPRGWRRLLPREESHASTGYDLHREAHLGVSVTRRQNGRYRIAFDVFRLNLKLTASVLDRIERRWREQASTFSKPIQRRMTLHTSASFVELETFPERVEEWKSFLEALLTSSGSYEQL
jgi:hypothetical protein